MAYDEMENNENGGSHFWVAAGHRQHAACGVGSVAVYRNRPETLLWALSASLAGLLLAALNLLRVGRPHDHMLAWISFVGCLGWLAIVVAFGVLIGNFFDFRVVIQGTITLVLAIFSLRTGLCKRP